MGGSRTLTMAMRTHTVPLRKRESQPADDRLMTRGWATARNET